MAGETTEFLIITAHWILYIKLLEIGWIYYISFLLFSVFLSGKVIIEWNPHPNVSLVCHSNIESMKWSAPFQIFKMSKYLLHNSSERLIVVLAFTCDRSVLVRLPSRSTTEERKGLWQLCIWFYLFCCTLHSALSFFIVILDKADQTENGKVHINHRPQLEKWAKAQCSEICACHMPKWVSPLP